MECSGLSGPFEGSWEDKNVESSADDEGLACEVPEGGMRVP